MTAIVTQQWRIPDGGSSIVRAVMRVRAGVGPCVHASEPHVRVRLCLNQPFAGGLQKKMRRGVDIMYGYCAVGPAASMQRCVAAVWGAIIACPSRRRRSLLQYLSSRFRALPGLGLCVAVRVKLRFSCSLSMIQYR
jgi:hypothetical protein